MEEEVKEIPKRNYTDSTISLNKDHTLPKNYMSLIAYFDLSKKANQITPPDELRRQIAKNTTVLEPIAEDQFLCAFSHIFAGGYAAGYYSYKWAEVLSSDAFAAFEEAGLSNKDKVRKIGKKYRDSILSLGGCRSPNQVFKQFRGRLPSTKALIRHSGLS